MALSESNTSVESRWSGWDDRDPDNISLLDDVNGRKGPEEQEEAPTLDWIASCWVWFLV